MIAAARISDLAGLEALSAEWSELVERAPDATPFQRPEWMVPWWQWFGSGELHALAFRHESRLVGLLPFFIHLWNGRRQATLAGSGISDCLGLLAEPRFAGACAQQACEYLRECAGRWDVCDFQDLSAASPLVTCAPGSFPCVAAESTPWMRAKLPSRAAGWEASLSPELRRDLRRLTRKMQREGELRFEAATDGVGLLGELFRLHQRRWARAGGPASTADREDTQQFLREAMRRFRDAGKLRLYVLWHRGEAAAMILALADRGVVWDLMTGMDPALARFSPGSLLLKSAIADAIREGASAWDFLRGAEPYKLRWGAKPIPATRLSICGYSA